MNTIPIQPGIKRYFHVQRFCFSCVGIDVTSLEQTTTSHLKFWFPMISLISICLPILLYASENIHDLDKATDSLSPFWQIVIVISKMIYFKMNSRKIITAVQKLWMWNLEAKGQEHKILAAENRNDIVFSSFYHLAVASTGLIALLAPFLIAGFYAWKGEKFWENLEQPARAAYRIDKNSCFGYIFVYAWNVSSIYFLIYGSVSADSLFSWFMCNIAAHFRILKHRLRQAGGQNGGRSSTPAICDCIAYHCRTLEMAAEFNDAFRVIVFIKFAISCIQVCCLAFQLSRSGELFDQVYHGLFLVSVSIQLILYCYGGQRIQNQSDSITNEIYDSFHWQSLSLSQRKMLIFSMRRSQMPCKVSGIFFTASLSLFLWVYRTAASFITLLWTVEEKKREMQ